MNERLIQETIIYNYINRTKLADARRATYYEKGITIPKKYQTLQYEFRKHNYYHSNWFYCGRIKRLIGNMWCCFYHPFFGDVFSHQSAILPRNYFINVGSANWRFSSMAIL